MFISFSLGTRCAFSSLGISGNRWSSDGISPLSKSFARASNNISRHQALQSDEEEACQRQENNKSQNVIMFVSTWPPCFQPVCTLQSCTVRIYLQSCTEPDNACTRWLKDRLEETFLHLHINITTHSRIFINNLTLYQLEKRRHRSLADATLTKEASHWTSTPAKESRSGNLYVIEDVDARRLVGCCLAGKLTSTKQVRTRPVSWGSWWRPSLTQGRDGSRVSCSKIGRLR